MAKSKALELVVITPERQVLSEHVDEVVIPAHDGELGVLNRRAPLMCELGIGQLRYTVGAQTQRVFIDGGFAQVLDNHVAVLTPRALPAELVTPDVVRAAEREAADAKGTTDDARLARERAQQRARVLAAMRG